MNSSSESTLLVGEIGEFLWVRVEGRGSFQNSPDLKAVAARAVSLGKKKLIVDLKNSPLMDSTFMGTLTGLSLNRQNAPMEGLVVVNANERNIQLLENLGLDQIFEVDKNGEALAGLRAQVDEEMLERERRSTLDKTEHAAHVLEAHEALARANPSNLERFRDVVTFLKSEIAGAGPQA